MTETICNTRQKNTADPLLSFHHVSVSYDGREVVHDVSLSVNKGEILGIAGESGSGKSTLIRAAMGLLDNGGLVTRGDIFYKGINVTESSAKQLRSLRGPEMAMVFQNTAASLCPVRTVEKQLYESIRAHENIEKKEIRNQAIDLLSRLGIQDGERVLKSFPFELSGGMNQRVGIMLSMLLNPALLFADEPTSALDVTMQKQIAQEMLLLQKNFGTTVVLVSHNIGLLQFMADNIAVMKDGCLVEYGSRDQILNDPKEAYTKELIHSVPRLRRG